MPLMKDLLPVAARVIRGRSKNLLAQLERLGDNIELWMSYLAQSPPWLSDADGLYNQSVFARLSRAIAEEVFDRQNAALARPAPPWLLDLVRKWHERRSIVLSLNYDALIEKALYEIAGSPYPVPYQIPVPPIDARDGLAAYGQEHVATMRLFKLHGSVNWYYHGPRAGSHGIHNLLLNFGWSRDSLADHVEEIGGLEPLVVPPVIVKDPYFANDSLREQWRIAGGAASGVKRLVLIGYSLPVADQLMRFFLETTVDPADVIVVDTEDGVADRAQKAFPKSHVNRDFVGGPDPISQFATWY